MNRQVIRTLKTKPFNSVTSTISSATQPAQTKSIPITKPFGLDKPILLNHTIPEKNQYNLSSIWYNLTSVESRAERSKKIDYDIKHSALFDAKSFNNVNGKIFTPPIAYFKSTYSKYFPDFIAPTLTKKNLSLYDVLEEKNISIVNVFSTVAGQQCINSYYQVENKDLYAKDFRSFQEMYPNCQIIDINIPQSWLKGFLLNLSINNLKKMIHSSRFDKYFILSDQIFKYEVRDSLLCSNSCSGYIYVLDKKGRIRWATSGYSTEEDLKLMWKVIKGLNSENKMGITRK
ncbi:Mitochondrial ATPase complex subunit ATP10 [Spathaspora sp. JA1]|nr:Mitochondrial ATPase complex subunit ATP10 [Spathaspora sp. JA1]